MKRHDIAFMLVRLFTILVIAAAIVFSAIEVLYRALYQGVEVTHHSQSRDR
jgi:hypothetical protein